MCRNLLNYSLIVVHQLLSCISTQLLVLSQHQSSKFLNHGESIQPPAEFSRKSQAGNLCHYKFTSLSSLRSTTLLVIYLHDDLTQFSNLHSSSNPSYSLQVLDKSISPSLEVIISSHHQTQPSVPSNHTSYNSNLPLPYHLCQNIIHMKLFYLKKKKKNS